MCQRFSYWLFCSKYHTILIIIITMQLHMCMCTIISRIEVEQVQREKEQFICCTEYKKNRLHTHNTEGKGRGGGVRGENTFYVNIDSLSMLPFQWCLLGTVCILLATAEHNSLLNHPAPMEWHFYHKIFMYCGSAVYS